MKIVRSPSSVEIVRRGPQSPLEAPSRPRNGFHQLAPGDSHPFHSGAGTEGVAAPLLALLGVRTGVIQATRCKGRAGEDPAEGEGRVSSPGFRDQLMSWRFLSDGKRGSLYWHRRPWPLAPTLSASLGQALLGPQAPTPPAEMFSDPQSSVTLGSPGTDS